MADCINMGGMATLLTVREDQGFGALTGAINGASIGGPRGEMKDLGDGVFELSLYHWFLDQDGSTIYTHDRETIRLDEKSGNYIMDVWYTVVEATGRFEGYSGTFQSHGWLKSATQDGNVAGQSHGMVRFFGKICRE